MKTEEHKRENRELARQERLPLLDRETFLSESYCSICPMNTHYNDAAPETRCGGCPVYAELRDIGDGLLEISRKYYVMPEELTWAAYLEIRDKFDWSKKEIAKYYGVGHGAFTEFTRRYEKLIPDTYEEDINMNLEVEKVQDGKPEDVLTLERYLDMQAEGKSDLDIIRELNITQHIMNKFKKANDLVRKTGPKRGKGKGKGKPKQQKVNKPVEKTPVAPVPKEEPIEVDTKPDNDKLKGLQFDRPAFADTQGAIDLSNSDIIGHTGVTTHNTWTPPFTGTKTVFIVMDTTDEAGSRCIKAVKGSRVAALMFIAEYVLEEDVNTAYLELVEHEVTFEEGEL